MKVKFDRSTPALTITLSDDPLSFATDEEAELIVDKGRKLCAIRIWLKRLWKRWPVRRYGTLRSTVSRTGGDCLIRRKMLVNSSGKSSERATSRANPWKHTSRGGGAILTSGPGFSTSSVPCKGHSKSSTMLLSLTLARSDEGLLASSLS